MKQTKNGSPLEYDLSIIFSCLCREANVFIYFLRYLVKKVLMYTRKLIIFNVNQKLGCKKLTSSGIALAKEYFYLSLNTS